MTKVETQADLLLDFHSKILALRRIEHIIKSYEMKQIFKDATREQKDEIIKAIYTFNLEGLKALMKHDQDVSVMGVRELRTLAKKLGVRRYNNMPKSLLLSAIAGVTDGRSQNAP